MDGKGRAIELFERFATGGEGTIDEFIKEKVSEELFIDYKRVTNGGASPMLEQEDRENLARAIAGFGNSEGGVIIWGVDCRNDPQRGDVPTTKHPIQNVKRFVSYLEGATSGCTLPPHDGVRHHVIERAGSDEGFAVTLVTKSMFAPHQCIVGKHKGRYHIRTGSNFEQVPHGVLAGMFGKRPAPVIFHMWELGVGISPASYGPEITHPPTSTPYVSGRLILRNHGNVVAKDLYVNYSFGVPGQNCLLYTPYHQWPLAESMSGWWHLIAPEDYRLAPGGMVLPVEFELYLRPPFERDLWYEISFGCEGSQVFRIVKTVQRGDVENAYSTFTAAGCSRKAGLGFARAVFAADEPVAYAEGFD